MQSVDTKGVKGDWEEEGRRGKEGNEYCGLYYASLSRYEQLQRW